VVPHAEWGAAMTGRDPFQSGYGPKSSKIVQFRVEREKRVMGPRSGRVNGDEKKREGYF